METIIENTEERGVIAPYNFTEEEFREEIRKGEEGPFYSIEEAKSMLEKWKNARKKQ
jgi:hypothetical protein